MEELIKAFSKIKPTNFKGDYILVDEEDHQYLDQWKWFIDEHGYPMRSAYVGRENGKDVKRTIRMHQLLLPTPQEKKFKNSNNKSK